MMMHSIPGVKSERYNLTGAVQGTNQVTFNLSNT